jgi:hypothetical protein
VIEAAAQCRSSRPPELARRRNDRTRRRQSRQCVMGERFVPPGHFIDSEVYPGNASEVVGVHHGWAFVPGATVIGRIDRLPA